jgi:hypothetical protein
MSAPESLASNRPADAKFRLLGGLLSLFFAFWQFRMIVLLLGGDYTRSVDAAEGVVTGHPHWRIYQNRVLGPYMIEWLSKIFPTFLAAHVFFSIFTLVVAGYLAWHLGRRITGNWTGAVMAILVFHITFLALLSRPWLYAWDYLDAIVFLLFLDFVLAKRPWPWFALLFAVAIFNRDSALFIALWMVLDPLVKWALARRQKTVLPFDWGKSLAGIACGLAGVLIVQFLRNHLLIEEIGPKIFPESFGTPGEFGTYQLDTNFQIIALVFTQYEYSVPFLPVLFLVLVAFLAVRMTWINPIEFAGLALVHLALIGSLMVFSLLLETRAFVALIPFVVMSTVILATRAGMQAGVLPSSTTASTVGADSDRPAP